MSNLMQGKRGLIMGLANERSIAWGISKALQEAGAELAFSSPNERFERKVRPLAEKLGSDFVEICDVNNDDDIQKLVASVSKKFGKIDFIVHAIAFSNKDELAGRYLDTTRDNFKNTMDVSCFSLTAVAKAFEDIMNENGSIITLSYYGAEKYIPNYNVMGVAKAALEASVRYLAVDLGNKGIRINSISAGPIKTLAASGITGFKEILDHNDMHAPLKRNVTLQDVGGSALFLLSDLGSGVTGENIYVDAGANVVGMALNSEE